MVLSYNADGARPKGTKPAAKAVRRESWREILDPAEMPLFNTLREWRGQRAREEGIPPYVICNNRQLAEVVHSRPQSLNKLAEIEGFGAAKLKRYGAEMLSFLRSTKAEGEPSPSRAAGDGGKSHGG